MTDIPTKEPSEIIAGDYVTWKIAGGDYPASDGWALSYSLVKSGVKIDISSSASSDDHLVAVAKTTTANWAAGKYRYQGYFEKGAERYMLREGRIEIFPNYAAQDGGYDFRSHAEKALSDLEAMIEGRATKDQASRVINGEIIGKMPIHRLIEWRDHYRAEINREKQAKGEGKSADIAIRFVDD